MTKVLMTEIEKLHKNIDELYKNYSGVENEIIKLIDEIIDQLEITIKYFE